jgi:RNA polymerase sigma-70 factor (ECF subfamily)
VENARGDRVHDPDPRTLQRARSGDLRAFEELVRSSQAEVYRFALHLTHDHALAEDVTQETFLRAFRFIRGYRGAQRFGSWLFAIARNCSMDALRKRGRIATMPEQDLRTTPDASVRAELDAALAAVSADHREAFLLVEVFGLSYQETADVLGVAVGTVKSRMFRARQALCQAIAGGEEATR